MGTWCCAELATSCSLPPRTVFRQALTGSLQMLLYLKKDKNAWKIGTEYGCSASPLMRCWTSTSCRR